MNIYNVGTKAVNLYLLDSGSKRLLIDSGFPNSTIELGRQLRQTGFKIRDIDYLLVTHFHVDHAGAVQELKDYGIKFILLDIQVNYIQIMEKMIEDKWTYKKIEMSDNYILKIEESSHFLEGIGIEGQILSTPGHSEDSVSLVINSGEAFTGDLLAEFLVEDSNSPDYKSWNKIKEYNGKYIYPAHGSEYVIN